MPFDRTAGGAERFGFGQKFPLKYDRTWLYNRTKATADRLVARYDLALLALLACYYPRGLLAWGATPMLVSFMSRMAGSVLLP